MLDYLKFSDPSPTPKYEMGTDSGIIYNVPSSTSFTWSFGGITRGECNIVISNNSRSPFCEVDYARIEPLLIGSDVVDALWDFA